MLFFSFARYEGGPLGLHGTSSAAPHTAACVAHMPTTSSCDYDAVITDADWSVRVQGISASLSAARIVRSNPLEAVSAGTIYRRINDADVPPLTHLIVNDELVFQLPAPPGFKE
jgi:hypothetical protein